MTKLGELKGNLGRQFSFDFIKRQVQEAIDNKHKSKAKNKDTVKEMPWIKEIYTDRVIYEMPEKADLFEVDYTIDTEGKVTLGSERKVKIEYTAAE